MTYPVAQCAVRGQAVTARTHLRPWEASHDHRLVPHSQDVPSDLAAVPDPVFSGAMVGPGTAIDPVREPSEAVAPVDGVIVSLHPHAFVVVDDSGHGVLTHLGIDTVQLNGEGFELLVNKGRHRRARAGRGALGPGRRRGRRQVAGLIRSWPSRRRPRPLTELREDGEVKAGESLSLEVTSVPLA